ncbi:hypothetical protein [Paenibacillus qinlingensis]|uniref:hypothetical protein n=1 Tax=Paenibacillus qinlingensis TaxID=1837343 RepID=UPI001565DAAB|nr:hypothetical protein [Paenibacillus qinlingensis]NQX64348.1 hypothetical protein [Paenibacillus qinlingensis]
MAAEAIKSFCNWKNKTLPCVYHPCYIITSAARQTGWQRKRMKKEFQKKLANKK